MVKQSKLINLNIIYLIMKAIHYSKIIFLLTVILFVFVSSCDKTEDEPAGPPSLSHVTTIKDVETIISGGNMGDWIAIHGKNLKSTYEIFFNDVEVNMEEVYYENEVLYLQVPIKIPLDVTDKLTVITMGGEITYDFVVGVPDLELTYMFNEYTFPGDTIKIYGRFLDLYEVDSDNTVVIFGDIQTPVIDNGSTFITAKVPVNVQPNVKVKAVNSKYDATAVCPGFYQDKHNVITTFDDDFPHGSVGATWASVVELFYDDDPTKPASSGNCLKFFVNEGNAPTGLGWWYMMENSYDYSQDMIDNRENYVLKFELRMGSPIRTTNFFIYNRWNNDNPLPVLSGETFSVQENNQWQTISVPFEALYLPTHEYPPSNLNFRVENFAPVEPVNMFFDNFRMYKKGE